MDTMNLYNNSIKDLKELKAKLIELNRLKLAERVENAIKEMEGK